VVIAQAGAILGVVAGLMAVKTLILFALARLLGSSPLDSLHIGLTLSQGGEFAFVLFSEASRAGLIGSDATTFLTAAVTVSMALTPLTIAVSDRAIDALAERQKARASDIPDERSAVVLVGFGRMGQLIAQILYSAHVRFTAIDNDEARIDAARRYGFRVYFGDVRRADILRAAGADTARLVILAIDDAEASLLAVDQIRRDFPTTRLAVRAVDRAHALALMERDVEVFQRETVESALSLGRQALHLLGLSDTRIETVSEDVRRRDLDRLDRQHLEGNLRAGRDLLHQRTPRAPEASDPAGDRS
jgi:voltage-gated potassium channel Kch